MNMISKINLLNGILVINKPSDMTSHDVVDVVRRKLKMKRVGHAGTLDPLATGVLVLLIGRATKLFDRFSAFDKAYEATITLGLCTDTSDIRGKTIAQHPIEGISREEIEKVMLRFLGSIEQVPPMVSALKFKGKRLYQLAREGIHVERKPRQIVIHSFKILDFSLPKVKFFLECSKGTYVRQIAEDMGSILGCGGCISQIHRTKVGPFTIDQAIALDKVNSGHVLTISDCAHLLA
jgi:tRNA pseudouridine55 synthase